MTRQEAHELLQAARHTQIMFDVAEERESERARYSAERSREQFEKLALDILIRELVDRAEQIK